MESASVREQQNFFSLLSVDTSPASPSAGAVPLPPLQQQQQQISRKRTKIHRCSSDPVLISKGSASFLVFLLVFVVVSNQRAFFFFFLIYFFSLFFLPSAEQSSSTAPLPHSLRTTDSSTQTSQPTLAQTQAQVTLRRGGPNRAPRRPRPSSLVDYQSYRHTQQLVRKILEQPAAQGLAPEVQELVESIRNVLESDQEHMEEAVRCASFIEQVGVFTRVQQD